MIEARRLEPYDVHEGTATVARHFLDGRRCTLLFRHQPDQLADDMTELMNVLLTCDMAVGATRILNILLPIEHLPYRFRLRPFGVPHLHREHDRVAAWIIVEHGLDRRVGINPAVPIGIAVDTDR